MVVEKSYCVSKMIISGQYQGGKKATQKIAEITGNGLKTVQHIIENGRIVQKQKKCDQKKPINDCDH